MAKKKGFLGLGLSNNEMAIVGGIAIAAYFLFSGGKAFGQGAGPTTQPVPPSPGTGTGTSTGSGTTTGSGAYCPPDNFQLAQGLSGSEVLRKESPLVFKMETAALQRALNKRHNACLLVDGFFGSATENALNSAIGKTSTTLNEMLQKGYSWT